MAWAAVEAWQSGSACGAESRTFPLSSPLWRVRRLRGVIAAGFALKITPAYAKLSAAENLRRKWFWQGDAAAAFLLTPPLPSLSYQPAGRMLRRRWKQISVFWQLRVLLLESVCQLLDVLKYFISTFQTQLFELLWKVLDFRTTSSTIIKLFFFLIPRPSLQSHS